MVRAWLLVVLCELALAPVDALALTQEQCRSSAVGLADMAAKSESFAQAMRELNQPITTLALGSEGDAFNHVIQFGQARNKVVSDMKDFAAAALAVREDMLACAR